MIKHVVFLFFTLFAGLVIAQSVPGSNFRTKTIRVTSDTVQLDSLSLIPKLVQLFSNGVQIDTNTYLLNEAAGLIVFKIKPVADSITAKYRVFPFNFSIKQAHKNINDIRPDVYSNYNPFIYKPTDKSTTNFFKSDGLNKTGSIARGISFGNNQDVVVNSHLNLQLAGKLTNNIDILLAATDDNIPFQPDGTTQQLQEFDKVFIQLSDKRSKLIAGDFQLGRPNSYFMNFNKKNKGLNFLSTFKTNSKNTDTTQGGINRINFSAAISRGKFARQVIVNGSDYQLENNQGPYRLKGAENEPFIIILSGTEKIYLDGILLERGQENDYIIDYNTAQVTFTPKKLITKDRRIVVEFQYSDKNYTRSLVHFGDEFEQGKLKLRLNVFSEQDSKDQPLQQELSDSQKQLLAAIGDTLEKAVSPAYDSTTFNNSEVFYRRTDTLGYKNIFIYSTDASVAHYRVRFSYKGPNNGNYRQINSSANGKVYAWTPPLGNIKQGDYDPEIPLITPKQKQMFTLASDYELNATTKLSFEGAITNNDVNTFSKLNKQNDIGFAGNFKLQNSSTLSHYNDSLLSKKWTLNTSLNYEGVQKYFSPIERYRAVEFERDWNRQTTTINSDQHMLIANAGVIHPQAGGVNYRFNTFLEGSNYQGFKNDAQANLHWLGFNFIADASILNSKATTLNTAFLRHKAELNKKIKWIVAGVWEMSEENKFKEKNTDSLLYNSYRFLEWETFIQTSDTLKNKLGISYKQRTDDVARSNAFKPIAFAESFNLNAGLFKNPNHTVNFTATYRRLTIKDTLLTAQKPDNTILGRIEYNFTIFNGAITSGTFYEIGSGLENKKEYSFIQVPAGQGIYTWKDYNNNGIKELNEFEVSPFPDQAIYIKVYTPTREYIKTYSNQFSQSLNLRPAAVWQSKEGVLHFLSLFSNQTVYRVDRKTTNNKSDIAYNPFLIDSATALFNGSARNTVFFNQLSPYWGLDYSIQDNRNKTLLTNGYEERSNTLNDIHLRWNITRKLTLQSGYKNGIKANNSQYFTTRNYSIRYYEADPHFSFQPNTSFRTTLSYRYAEKQNAKEWGNQRAIVSDFGAELKYNTLQKGSFSLKANFIQIKFDAAENSSIAFEMLEGLKIGKNYTWGAAFQRNLNNNMQISITYDGRQSEGSKTIHTGGAQIRAYF